MFGGAAGGSVTGMSGMTGGGYTGGAGGASGDIYNTTTTTTNNSSGFNSSGWNVNFGSGTIDSGGNKMMLYGLLAVGGLLAWQYFKGRRRGR